MNAVQFPEGFQIEPLRKSHPRKSFDCGKQEVNDWLQTKALQNQDKRLSTTKVLLDLQREIAGFYTLAIAQVDFGDLPTEETKRLPKRFLPVAVLAWLGVHRNHQGQGIGDRLLAQALRDCYEAGQIFAFVAVILDCLDDSSKSFYQRWDFEELPGQPYRLFLSAKQLNWLMNERSTFNE